MEVFFAFCGKLIRRGYALLFAFVFVLYPAAAALPPLLMVKGHTPAAGFIYKIFTPFCHQLPQRSWFLFGPQSRYPLEVPEGSGLRTIYEASGTTSDAVRKRFFIGTPEMGYKMAICQRDLAIYLSLALFCLIFFACGNRIAELPLWAWILFGLLPVGMDGLSQLAGNVLPGLIPARESTPMLRTVTGALFGFTLGWFLLPRLEKTLPLEETA